jgi:hypothetical protein
MIIRDGRIFGMALNSFKSLNFKGIISVNLTLVFPDQDSFFTIVKKLGDAVVLIVASILRLSIRGVKLGAKLYHKYCSQYSQAALQSWLQQVQYTYLYLLYGAPVFITTKMKI